MNNLSCVAWWGGWRACPHGGCRTLSAVLPSWPAWWRPPGNSVSAPTYIKKISGSTDFLFYKGLIDQCSKEKKIWIKKKMIIINLFLLCGIFKNWITLFSFKIPPSSLSLSPGASIPPKRDEQFPWRTGIQKQHLTYRLASHLGCCAVVDPGLGGNDQQLEEEREGVSTSALRSQDGLDLAVPGSRGLRHPGQPICRQWTHSDFGTVPCPSQMDPNLTLSEIVCWPLGTLNFIFPTISPFFHITIARGLWQPKRGGGGRVAEKGAKSRQIGP